MTSYHEKLKEKIDNYAHGVYKISRLFPKEEMFGITSQLRRSSLSVMLNYIEGFARRKKADCKVYRNFMEISYGSLKESKYLLHFSMVEKYYDVKDYKKIIVLADEIGAMLYKIINN